MKKIEVTGCGNCKLNGDGYWCNAGEFVLDRGLKLGLRPSIGNTCPLEDGPITIELKVREKT